MLRHFTPLILLIVFSFPSCTPSQKPQPHVKKSQKPQILAKNLNKAQFANKNHAKFQLNMGHDERIENIKIAPNGKYAVSLDLVSLIFWDLEKRRKVFTLLDISDFHFDMVKKRLWVLAVGGDLVAYDFKGNRLKTITTNVDSLTFAFHSQTETFAFSKEVYNENSNDNKSVANVKGSKKPVKTQITIMQNGKNLNKIEFYGHDHFDFVGFTKDRKYLITKSMGIIVLFDVKTGQKVIRHDIGNKKNPDQIVFCPQVNKIAYFQEIEEEEEFNSRDKYEEYENEEEDYDDKYEKHEEGMPDYNDEEEDKIPIIRNKLIIMNLLTGITYDPLISQKGFIHKVAGSDKCDVFYVTSHDSNDKYEYLTAHSIKSNKPRTIIKALVDEYQISLYPGSVGEKPGQVMFAKEDELFLIDESKTKLKQLRIPPFKFPDLLTERSSYILSPDSGKAIIRKGRKKYFELWHADGKFIPLSSTANSRFRSVAWSKDGHLLSLCVSKHVMAIFNAVTGNPVASISVSDCIATGLTPRGRKGIVLGRGKLNIVDIKKGVVIKTFSYNYGSRLPYLFGDQMLTFSPNGKVVTIDTKSDSYYPTVLSLTSMKIQKYTRPIGKKVKSEDYKIPGTRIKSKSGASLGRVYFYQTSKDSKLKWLAVGRGWIDGSPGSSKLLLCSTTSGTPISLKQCKKKYYKRGRLYSLLTGKKASISKNVKAISPLMGPSSESRKTEKISIPEQLIQTPKFSCNKSQCTVHLVSDKIATEIKPYLKKKGFLIVAKCKTAEELSSLSKLSDVTNLSLETEITNLSTLRTFTSLRHLHLKGRYLTNKSPERDISSLFLLPNLTGLELENIKIAGSIRPGKAQALRSIKFKSSEVKGLLWLSKQTQLTKIVLYYSSGFIVKNLKWFPNLRWLVINRTGYKNLDFLKSFGHLEHLELNSGFQKSFSFLKGLKKLKYLDLSKTIRFSSLKNLPHSLVVLKLNNTALSSLKGISKFKNLKRLEVAGTSITSLRELKLNRSLETLYLSNTKVSSLKGLEDLTKLKNLGFSYTRVKSLKYIKTDNLVNLFFNHTHVKSLKQLKAHPALQKIYFDATKVKDISHLITCLNLNEISNNTGDVPFKQFKKLEDSFIIRKKKIKISATPF